MKNEEFIDTVLVNDIGKVIEAGCPYLAFGLIAQGIETLGALLDEMKLNDINLSERRFRNAINTLFNYQTSRYPKYVAESSEYDLYKYLRCGMVHTLSPSGKIGFTTKCKAEMNGLEHLILSENGQLILVIEDLFEDFKKACKKCKNLLVKKTHSKLKGDVLIISNDVSGGNY